jgi:hypothetical protein
MRSLAGETVLWTATDGIHCVLIPYDETRYQLRLMRTEGTVKADLFPGYADALAASREWRAQLESVENQTHLGVIIN